MSDRQGLIEAIRQQPDEDTPRLALADWYEENGDAARGEFIRVQCELARLDPIDARYPELHIRQLQIQAEHERAWLGEWADKLVRWEFRRGLLDEVTIEPEPYCRGGANLFRNHPIWRVAFVDNQGESLPTLAICDVLSRAHSRHLRAIDAAACRPTEQAAAMFGGEIHTNAWLSELARANAIDQLRELSLYGGTRGGRENINLNDWKGFCAASHLRGLTHLDLSNRYDYRGNHAAWEGVFETLAAAKFASELRSLRFEGCYIGSDALIHLPRAGQFANLRALTIGGVTTGASVSAVLPSVLDRDVLPALRDLTIPYGRHLVEVGDHPGWNRLERIGLVGCDDHEDCTKAMHAPIWRAFCRSPHIRPTTLVLGTPGYFDPEEVGVWEELAGAAWFGDLRELRISFYNRSCAPLLARAIDRFPRVHSLSLNPDTDVVKRLAAWPGLANLVELGLNNADGTTAAEAAEELFDSSYLTTRLTRLEVSGACRSENAVAALAGCAALAGLTHLDFAFNELTPDGAATLATSPHLKHLRSLHTWSEWAEADTAEDQAWLRLADPKAFPQLRDIVIGSASSPVTQEELRSRFGPRLRVFSDC
jgi:uncharacterized protein (TIGR02996 family)